MRISIISLFPEMFEAIKFGITGRAIQQGHIELNFYNPRDFTHDKHKTVDDSPYGGGPGMVMRVQPLQDAITAAKQATCLPTKTIYLSPQGQPLKQSALPQFLDVSHLILIAGRYEGIDERLLSLEVDEEWSIGDYVLTGGELPAMVLIDALTRLLPDTLGDPESAQQDSFSNGLLDFPHYTRPKEVAGLAVPEVLLRGNHAAIQQWRLQQALGRTWLRRPEILRDRQLDPVQQQLLAEFIRTQKQ